jgi:RNA polymerase sigma factor (sigma-70 family)
MPHALNPSALLLRSSDRHASAWAPVSRAGRMASFLPEGLSIVGFAPIARYSKKDMSQAAPQSTTIERALENPPFGAVESACAAAPETHYALEASSNALLQQALAELAKAQRGSAVADRAFSTLYEATVDRVYSVVRRFLRDDHLCEEVVEEVYCQAWRDAATHDDTRGPVIAWLLMMARSRALDFLRKQRSSPIDYVDNIEEAADELAAEDPFSMAATAAEQGVVHEALLALKGPARQMVSLAFMRGLTHQEIADVLKLPLGTVKTTIRRALQQMRTAIETRAPEVASQYGAAALSALLVNQEIEHGL